MKRNTTAHRVLGAVLMASVLLFYGVGPVLSMEIEHHHHVEDHHGDHDHDDHHLWHVLLSHHGDDSHHEPASSSSDEQGDGGENQRGSPHSHGISLGIDGFACCPDLETGAPEVRMHGGHRMPAAEKCPDGPSFDLIKPPQLV